MLLRPKRGMVQDYGIWVYTRGTYNFCNGEDSIEVSVLVKRLKQEFRTFGTQNWNGLGSRDLNLNLCRQVMLQFWGLMFVVFKRSTSSDHNHTIPCVQLSGILLPECQPN